MMYSTEGYYHLAQLYHHGLSVTKDPRAAFGYYLKAADQVSFAHILYDHHSLMCVLIVMRVGTPIWYVRSRS
jgi:TPR repeat protein